MSLKYFTIYSSPYLFCVLKFLQCCDKDFSTQMTKNSCFDRLTTSFFFSLSLQNQEKVVLVEVVQNTYFYDVAISEKEPLILVIAFQF